MANGKGKVHLPVQEQNFQVALLEHQFFGKFLGILENVFTDIWQEVGTNDNGFNIMNVLWKKNH